jgi:hypothetical protein
MTPHNIETGGLNRRDVMKAAGFTAGMLAIGGGVRAFSGFASAASHTASKTVRSGLDTRVVGYRAGDDPSAFPAQTMDVPANLTWVHSAWSGTSHTFDADTRWIWHGDTTDASGQVIDGEPTYYVKEPVAGDVVEFEDAFSVPGTPVSGTLYITADNGYEVWVNGTYVGSATVQDGDVDWEDSDLSHPYVPAVSGTWSDVEAWDVSGLLQQGANTLTVLGANEQMSPDDVTDAGSPEATGTVRSNPGGVIYELDLEYEACTDCAFDGTVKFEYVVEEDEDGNVVFAGFVPEDAPDFDAITYDSIESKDGEMYEPVTAVFASSLCPDTLTATVKAGPTVGPVDVTAGDDSGTLEVSIVDDPAFTNPRNGKQYAISYVEFACVDGDDGDDVVLEPPEGEALTVEDESEGDADRGHGNDPDGVDEDNPGRGRGMASTTRGRGRGRGRGR